MSIDIKNPRVRMAPSPTGFFHIGSARTALFNYLFAKKYNGKFILRIEDTDQERSKKEYENDIFESMHWLDIGADEDPRQGGPYGPYRQSERLATYRPYLEKLLNEGKVFECFCSKESDNKSISSDQPSTNIPHFCPDRDTSYNENETRPYIIRYKNDKSIKNLDTTSTRVSDYKLNDTDWVSFTDEIRGQIDNLKFQFGDFVLAKNIDNVLYNFAVVVDDYEMKITHVIRGEDHISNTPKQILLQQSLGFPQPHYAHLPLILGTDRSKLSKRHGATSIDEYKEQGYLPEALINFMALLGWNPGTDQELFSKKELEKSFSIERVQKSGAVFDTAKLNWMNGEYIRKKSSGALVKLVQPFLEDFLKFSIPNDQFSKEYIEKVIFLEQPRLKKLSEIGERVDFFFKEPEYDKALLRWKTMTDENIKNSLQKAEKLLSQIKEPIDKKTLEKAFFGEIGDSDKGILLWPLRVALSGKKASPGPFEIIEILGIKESIKRLGQAEQKIS